jgi:PhnB protein
VRQHHRPPDPRRALIQTPKEAEDIVSKATNQQTPGVDADSADPENAGSERPVAPVPEHLHTVTPRLAVTDAAAAIDFYAKAFDAREIGERHTTPDGTLIHAELQIGDSIVMITQDDGYTALLNTYWPDVETVWDQATAAGAQILHPLADQFYGERSGRLRDPFGQEWTLSTRLEKLTADEIAARMPTQR